MYKLFLTLRYLRRRRIAYFAIAAVTLCVAMVLTVMSVMGGWLDMVKNRARGLLGDIVVDNHSYGGFPLYQEFIDEISKWPEIAMATPVIHSYGMIRFPKTSQQDTVRVVGIRLDEVVKVNAFGSGLYYEQFYPGTTTFAEQRRPVLGRDFSVEPRVTKDGTGEYLPFLLPEPYHSALEGVRKKGPLVDPDSRDNSLNRFLRENGEPIIPGEWMLNEEAEAGLETPGWNGEERPGLILGRDIVAKRESDGRYDRLYAKGTEVDLVLIAVSAVGTSDPIPIRTRFRYADDSRTGIYEIDSQYVYCDFDRLQKLLQMDAADRIDPETGKVLGRAPARCQQIQIKLAPGVGDAAAVCQRLTDSYHALAAKPEFTLDGTEMQLAMRVEAETWEQTQAHIIAPVEKEKVLVTILFSIISLVAVALILCILYMIVLQKTRDIGILKAVGGSAGGVAMIWVLYGAAVGLVGGVLGSILGTTFVHHINQVQDFLISLNPQFRVWDLKVYSFDQIPNKVDTWDVVAVFLFAVASSTLGSFGAAWRAGTMEPVESIRYE